MIGRVSMPTNWSGGNTTQSTFWGKARQGWFIFEESTARVEYFKSEKDLADEIEHRKLGQPLSKRKTPADGWNEAWMPAVHDRCTQVSQDAGTDGEISGSLKQSIRKYCDQVPDRVNGR
jgi:hypothetical protein